MKKTLPALCLTALFLLSGCGGDGAASHGGKSVPAVQSALESGVAAAEAVEPLAGAAASGAGAVAAGEAAPPPSAGEAADVDLTQLNATMIFSQVSRMLSEPEQFVGKTVRMAGRFALAFGYGEDGEPNPEQAYFACVIPDAAACCASGIEFELAGDYRYPDNYPGEGDEITVTGVFETYEEYGLEYCRLADAVMGA